MAISVNQGISFTDPSQVEISGVVTGSKVIDDVTVTSDDQLITTQALNEDATWNTTVSFSNTSVETIVATANYGDGTSDNTGLLLTSNEPLINQYTAGFPESNGYAGLVYGQHGRELYTFTGIVDDNQQGYINAIGGGGSRIAYTDFDNAFETIENFRPGGQNHDTLNLSDTGLQTLAQVLHHTTMSDGDATIHIAPGESVTLSGVSKAQLAANPHDFVFTGGHLPS